MMEAVALRRGCGLTVLIVVSLVACAHRAELPDAHERFAYRVDEYMETRALAEKAAGALYVTSDGRELDAAADRLAVQIQRLRFGLRQGVIFSGVVAPAFRRALAERLAQPDGPSLLRALDEVRPSGYHPAMNQLYPESEPVRSMPPSLLAALPPLPDALSYRFVGNALLLLDRNTRLVVDILPDALPQQR